MARRRYGLSYTRDATNEERAAYERAKRQSILANPAWAEELKRKEAEWRNANREKLRERQRLWRETNLERSREIKRNSYARNRDEINAKQREENRTEARKEFMREYLRKHRADNPELYRAYVHTRRARASGGKYTPEEWDAKLAEFSGSCAYCGSEELITRDHVIPLSRGGTNDISNIVPACRPCNFRKSRMTGEEWLQRMAQESHGLGR